MFAKQMFAQLRTGFSLDRLVLGDVFLLSWIQLLQPAFEISRLTSGLGFSQFSGLGFLTGVMYAAQRTVIVWLPIRSSSVIYRIAFRGHSDMGKYEKD